MVALSLLALMSTGFRAPRWGFFAHQKINRLAVFCLPPEMLGFYKANINYLAEAAVNPDRRRYAVVDEAPRHYIDLDAFGDSAAHTLPRFWGQAVKQFGAEKINAHGIVPWHVQTMYERLRDAFLVRDPRQVLRLSADIGHYVADAHVPLHTTSNYDGQKTGQEGIHAFWESRLPELYFDEYDFIVGKASYIERVQLTAWEIVTHAHEKTDSVLRLERELFAWEGDRKFTFETKGRQTVKVIAEPYAKKYHLLLNGMVERQFRASIKMTADLWYTAWIDAGQPDIGLWATTPPTEEEIRQRKEEVALWKERRFQARPHEGDSIP